MINKIYKNIKLLIKLFILYIFPNASYKVGSKFWFIYSEKYFGGYKTNIKRNIVSKYDIRSKKEISFGGMTGGDRMLIQGYAKFYVKFLKSYIEKRNSNLTILEVGILEGTGLALWSALFPNSKILGADIDLNYFQKNFLSLKSKGAFLSSDPILFNFDQLDVKEFDDFRIENLKFDIVIDDGLHSKDAILNTLKYFFPTLNEQFVYIIEDVNINLIEEIKVITKDCIVEQFGELIVIHN